MTAILNDAGKQTYGEIFPEGVPVMSPVAGPVPIEGRPEITAYMVNMFLVSKEQRDQIAEKLSVKFQVSKEAILSELTRGLPLRKEFVSHVAIDARFLL
jgi:hypothetical protein